MVFTELLNRFRTALQTDEDIRSIQSRSINPSDDNYPLNVVHIWAENKPVTEYNNMKLQQIPKRLFNLRAKDQYPLNISKPVIDNILARGRSDTGGLEFEIK